MKHQTGPYNFRMHNTQEKHRYMLIVAFLLFLFVVVWLHHRAYHLLEYAEHNGDHKSSEGSPLLVPKRNNAPNW